MFLEDEIITKDDSTRGILYKLPINKRSKDANSKSKWKKRFVILKRGFLFYYKYEPNLGNTHKPIGVLDLKQAKFFANDFDKTIIDIIPYKDAHKTAIIYLKAQNEILAKEWLDNFSENINETAYFSQKPPEESVSEKEVEQRIADMENYYKNMIDQYKRVISEYRSKEKTN